MGYLSSVWIVVLQQQKTDELQHVLYTTVQVKVLNYFHQFKAFFCECLIGTDMFLVQVGGDLLC